MRQEELIDSVIGDAILIIQVAPSWALFLALFSALFANYDNYWDKDIKTHLTEFVLLSKTEYEELLIKTGFFIQETQRSILEELIGNVACGSTDYDAKWQIPV